MIETIKYNDQRWYYCYVQGQEFKNTGQYLRRSRDHGKTWKRTEDIVTRFRLPSNRIMIYNPVEYFFDPEAGALFRILNEAEEVPGRTVWDESSLIQKTRRLFAQVSRDGGATWTPAEQIILKGKDHDFVHWADGITYGVNSALVEGTHFVKLPDGRILLPIKRYLPPDEASSYYPDDKAFLQVLQSGFLIGSWREDFSGLDWEQGGYIPNCSDCSCNGFDEGSAGILPDGRLFAILRVNVDTKRAYRYPSTKYYSISDDCGHTWSVPEPLRYTHGEIVYSPSSLANVFRSNKNGRFYLITNIIDAPTHGDDPRNVLQIAEIDSKTLRLIEDSVSVIEKYKPELGEPEHTRYSNFRWYEERGTNNIILFVTASGPYGKSNDGKCNYPSHSFRYEIVLPK